MSTRDDVEVAAGPKFPPTKQIIQEWEGKK